MVLIFPVLLVMLFVASWVGVTWLIGRTSGWHTLAMRFPDRREATINRFGWRSGWMGAIGARMSRVLWFDVCASGLRVTILWPFGAFNAPFFVPWNEIRTSKIEGFVFNQVRLNFGKPSAGTLRIYEATANEMAPYLPERNWPT